MPSMKILLNANQVESCFNVSPPFLLFFDILNATEGQNCEFTIQQIIRSYRLFYHFFLSVHKIY